jgi:hypothetical protein
MNGQEFPWVYYPPLTYSRRAWHILCLRAPCTKRVRFTSMIYCFMGKTMKIFWRTREPFSTAAGKRVPYWTLVNIVIGVDQVKFIGQEVDSLGLNMSQARIERTINLTQTQNHKEFYSFLGLVNYFKNHLRDHSFIAQLLHALISESNKHPTKAL